MTKLKMIIKLDKSKCIGCGTCCALCADVFEMAADGKSHLKGATEEETIQTDKNCAKEAAEACPVQCIKLSP